MVWSCYACRAAAATTCLRQLFALILMLLACIMARICWQSTSYATDLAAHQCYFVAGHLTMCASYRYRYLRVTWPTTAPAERYLISCSFMWPVIISPRFCWCLHCPLSAGSLQCFIYHCSLSPFSAGRAVFTRTAVVCETGVCCVASSDT